MTRLKEQNVLFFLRATQHGGTENVVLQLCEIFQPLVNKIVIISSGGFNKDKLRNLNVKHYVIPDISDKSPRVFFTVIRYLKNIVSKEKITIIHTHHRMAAFYVSLLGLYKVCHFINTSHNIFYDKWLLTRFAYKNAKLIACGESVEKNLREMYGLQDIMTIHNAVKAFEGPIKEIEELKQARDAGKFLIGNIGRLSEQKGMEYYIKAIPMVIEKHPEIQFYIIGVGEDEKKLKILGKKINAQVKFLGYRDDVQNVLAQLDLVVLSSLWEGLPLVPIESFSVGKTLIATKISGTCEVVKNAENGLLVIPRDSEQLAEKIIWMIEHPNERHKMEINALKCYKEKFSFSRFAESYVDYYKEY